MQLVVIRIVLFCNNNNFNSIAVYSVIKNPISVHVYLKFRLDKMENEMLYYKLTHDLELQQKYLIWGLFL